MTVVYDVQNARYAERVYENNQAIHPLLLVDVDGQTLALSTEQRLIRYGLATFYPLPEYGGLAAIQKYEAVLVLDPEGGEPWSEMMTGATADARILALVRRFGYDVNEGTFRPGKSLPVTI